MKRLVTFSLVILLVVGIGFSAESATGPVTLTFDDMAAWNATPCNAGKWIAEEYAANGIHFLGNFYGMVGTNYYDGVIYDDGLLCSIASAPAGGQYLGLAGTHPDGCTGNVGMVIQFDEYQTSFTFDCYAKGTGFGLYWVFDTAQGTELGQDLASGNWTPSRDAWGSVTIGDGSVPFNYVLIAGALAPGTQCIALDNMSFIGHTVSPGPDLTGIQLTGISTNLVSKVEVGDTLVFTANEVSQGPGTVHYQFFRRAGYGQPGWGGNSWQVMQNWSTSNLVSISFNTSGNYFVAVHCEYAGNSWAAGDPQGGIAVEVWPAEAAD